MLCSRASARLATQGPMKTCLHPGCVSRATLEIITMGEGVWDTKGATWGRAVRAQYTQEGQQELVMNVCPDSNRSFHSMASSRAVRSAPSATSSTCSKPRALMAPRRR